MNLIDIARLGTSEHSTEIVVHIIVLDESNYEQNDFLILNELYQLVI